MHASPHPNQVRSACERCRRQKLRCTRPDSDSACCARCLRLGLSCQPGTQRKVGRPSRKEIVRTTTTAIPSPASAGAAPVVIDDIPTEVFDQDLNGGSCSTGTSFGNDVLLNDLLNGASPTGLDWGIPNDMSFNFGGMNHLFGGPNDMPVSYEPQRLEAAPPAMLVLGSSDKLFASLSKVNIDLHRAWDPLSKIFTSTFGYELAFCKPGSSFVDLDSLKVVLTAAQEYLVTIKTLHRKIGTKKGMRPASGPSTPEGSDRALTVTCSMDSSNGSSPNSPFDSGSTEAPQDLILDSPTAFLVISCYSQIIKHIEAISSVVNSHFRDKTTPLMSPASEMSLMDVDILEFSTQVGLFSELVRNLICQITLVLGIPVAPWSDRTIWTGLLKADRYREMLNEELGGPTDGVWTTRPTKLLEIIEETRHLVLDAAMMGDG